MKMSVTRDTFAASIRKDETLSRPLSPKLYLGCDTCKMKNASNARTVKSNPKIDHGSREKRRRSAPDDKPKLKIKLTDLCDEDKKKIVELIEELSKYAGKNKRLSESVDYLNKVRKEQQDYIMQQADLYLKEKNIYLKEINDYNERLGYYETEMKGKTYKWEVHEQFMDNEICYLAKAIQRALDDKNDLLQQVNHLKQCLQQSLESFERLKNEVSQMTRPEPKKSEQAKMNECQTEWKVVVLPEVEKKISEEDESEEEYPSSTKTEQLTSTKKSSLNFINEKLNNLYSLLKGKNENPHFDKQKNRQTETDPNPLLDNHKIIDTKKNYSGLENHYRFVKPKSTKTCFGEDGILKKTEKPFKSNNDGDTSESKFNMKEANFQDLYHEERLLRELFYQKEGSDDHPDPVLFLNGCDFPYEGAKHFVSGKN